MLLDFSERMTSKQLSHVLVVQFVKNHEIWTFKVNFLCQKTSESSNFFFIEKYQSRLTFFVKDISRHFNFLIHLITKMTPKFDYSGPRFSLNSIGYSRNICLVYE